MFHSTCLSVPMACSCSSSIRSLMSVPLQTNRDLCFFKWLTQNNQILLLMAKPTFCFLLCEKCQGYLCLAAFRWIRLQRITAQPETSECARTQTAPNSGRLKASFRQDGFCRILGDLAVPRSRGDGQSALAHGVLALIPGVLLHYAPCRLN